MNAPTPKFTAGIDLIRRTGASAVEIRYSGTGDDAEQPPIAWVAVALYKDVFECSAGTSPEIAVMRLCGQLVAAVFDDDFDDTVNQALLSSVCWTMWDPELAKFRRGCE